MSTENCSFPIMSRKWRWSKFYQNGYNQKMKNNDGKNCCSGDSNAGSAGDNSYFEYIT